LCVLARTAPVRATRALLPKSCPRNDILSQSERFGFRIIHAVLQTGTNRDGGETLRAPTHNVFRFPKWIVASIRCLQVDRRLVLSNVFYEVMQLFRLDLDLNTNDKGIPSVQR